MRDVKKTRKADSKRQCNRRAEYYVSSDAGTKRQRDRRTEHHAGSDNGRNNRMKFDENSGLVKTWVRLVESGQYSKEQVPNIGNLREVVYKILEKGGSDK